MVTPMSRPTRGVSSIRRVNVQGVKTGLEGYLNYLMIYFNIKKQNQKPKKLCSS